MPVAKVVSESPAPAGGDGIGGAPTGGEAAGRSGLQVVREACQAVV